MVRRNFAPKHRACFVSKKDIVIEFADICSDWLAEMISVSEKFGRPIRGYSTSLQTFATKLSLGKYVGSAATPTKLNLTECARLTSAPTTSEIQLGTNQASNYQYPTRDFASRERLWADLLAGRRDRDSNPGRRLPPLNGFQDRLIRPL